MKVKFSDIIQTKNKTCKDHLILAYLIPCKIDKDIIIFFKDFGKSKYDINIVKLLHIESIDGYKIKSKIGETYIHFLLPNKFKTENILTSRLFEFKRNLSDWIENTLDIEIEI